MKPPDEVKRELVRMWLNKAEEDFCVSKHLLTQQSGYHGAIGFHSQQAAEKFLKAYLVRHQVEFPKTHDLEKIFDLVSSVDKKLADSLRHTAVLSIYGVEVRYPGDMPELSFEDAHKANVLAAEVREAINSSLDRYLKEE
jgi:HEPN domain-containing protein